MELSAPISKITSLTLIFFMLKFIRNVKRSKSQKQLPGPWKLPLVGSMHHLAGIIPHRALANLAKKHGPLMHLQLGEISAIVISSPRLAKEVLATNDIVFANRPQLLATTIVAYDNTDIAFSPHGPYWRQMRRICNMELLSSKKVKSFRSIREEETAQFIDMIRSSSGSPINFSENIFTLINMITCRSAFGKRYKEQNEFIELSKEVIELAGGFDVADVFPSFKFLHTLTGLGPKLMRIRKKIDQILEGIIDEHKQKIANTQGENSGGEEEDLVDVLLRLKESDGLEVPITFDNIKAIVLDIFSAGTDTSSGTLEWAMTELIKTPRVMEKAQDEVRQVLKGKKRIEENDIQQLSYLKQVMQETLRLHPPLPLLLPRESREECEIDGYTIPIKTKVIINAWAISRDPGYWKDAESFMPERFDGSKNMIGGEFQYLPFGAGRRTCPGMIMGLANTEYPLAQLLYHFNWTLPNGMKPEDVDVVERFGAAVKRKNELYLIPNVHLF